MGHVNGSFCLLNIFLKGKPGTVKHYRGKIAFNNSLFNYVYIGRVIEVKHNGDIMIVRYGLY